MSKFAIACLACVLGLTATISRADEEFPRTFRVQVQTPDGLVDLPLNEYKQFMELVPASANPSTGEIPEQELQKLKSASLQNFVKNKADGLLPEGADYYNDYYRQQHDKQASKAAPTHGSGQPGTFTVVSDGKRSILINTKTSASWLLVIDPQGSHWEEIKFPVPAATVPETPSTQAINTPYPVPYSPEPATSVDSFGDTPVPASMLSPSDIQRLEEAYKKQLETINTLATRLEATRDQAETIARTLEKQKEQLIKLLNDKGKEVSELKKKLEEAQNQNKESK